MKKRRIPKSDLDISPICLGTMTFGTPVGEAEALKLVGYALDKGINFIDTANMYEGYARYIGSPGGTGEEILGKAIAGRRGDFVIATKVGMKVGDAPEDEGTGPAAIRNHLTDIYYLHKPDPETPLLETLQALDEVIRAGKVRYYGISNYSAAQVSELLATADANGLPRPVIHQPPLSLLKQDLCADLLPLCDKEGIGVAPYQVLQGGLLTGKYRRGEPVPEDSRKAEKGAWVWDLTDELFDTLEAAEKKAGNEGITITQYAIRWALRQPAVVAPVIGIRKTSQIDDAVAAADGL